MSDPSSSLQYVRSSVIYLQYVLSLHLFVFNVPIPPCFVQQYGFSLHLFLFSVSSRRSFLFSVSSPSDFSSSVCLIPPLLSLQYVLSSDRSSSVHSSSVCPTPPVLSLQCVRPLHLSVFSMSEPSSFFSSVALPFLSSVCPFQHSFCSSVSPLRPIGCLHLFCLSSCLFQFRGMLFGMSIPHLVLPNNLSFRLMPPSTSVP